MTDQLQSLVNPVVGTALRLRAAWAVGRGPGFDAGRADLGQKLRALFAMHPPARAVPKIDTSGVFDLRGAGRDPTEDAYLGVGYPLACWVDELFILHSSAASAWGERKAEAEFYATNDRAWRFWRQARCAADRPGTDDLEVFFVCAALGFRGEWADDPAAFRGWWAATRDRVVSAVRQPWAGPPAADPPTRVPPRYGLDSVRRMAVFAGLSVAAAVPAAAWLVARQLGR